MTGKICILGKRNFHFFHNRNDSLVCGTQRRLQKLSVQLIPAYFGRKVQDKRINEGLLAL